VQGRRTDSAALDRAGRPGWRHEAWPALRYGRLLPRAATSRAAGRCYARLVAAVELRDTARRRAAVNRIARWQGVSRAAALRIFHASLLSEAREEADSAYFMRDGHALEGFLPRREALRDPGGRTLFATLHLGSPIFAFLFLRAVAALDVRAIGRKLDQRNPMPAAKRRYGLAKEAWLADVAGVDLLEPSAHAMTTVRDLLRDDRPVFAALDVPADVVTHSARVEIAGECVAFSSGAVRIAQLAGARVVPVIALSRPGGLVLHAGAPLDVAGAADAPAAVLRTLLAFVQRFPGEWWLWPYVHAAAT
jgi:hypothetical protein